MTLARKVLFAGIGLAASTVLWAGQASAQYYGRDTYFDRGDRYERRIERRDRYDRYDRYDRGPRRRVDPMAGMSLDERKRAIKNHREAQKKAIKRGYVIP